MYIIKLIIVIILIIISITNCARKHNLEDLLSEDKINVLVLGTFHFGFPNLDAIQTAEIDQIDVLLPEYQREIELIVEKLLRFKPTHIAIELPPAHQRRIDNLYNRYLAGNYELDRNEIDQIVFRIAKAMGLEKLYCVDEWGNLTENIQYIFDNPDSEITQAFNKHWHETKYLIEQIYEPYIFKTEGILAQLLVFNDEARIKRTLGAYLIGSFTFEYEPYDFTGVDFETGRWFSRNLKIFRNIQRIEAQPSDRILVMMGACHLNVLNYLFEGSSEYNLVRTNDFLR